MWILYILIGIVAIILLHFALTYNKFVRLDNRAREAFSTMDIYLKKRWDLVPNLVETVKGYAKHEKDTLAEVINLRNKSYDKLSVEDKLEANAEITKNISQIMAIAESYPELKASENFQKLAEQLAKLEDEIANSRKYYNGTVRMFNNALKMFPSNIVGKMLKYAEKPMFEASEEDRKSVKVEL